MSISLAVLLAAILLVLVAVLILRGRRQRVDFGDAPGLPAAAPRRKDAVQVVPAAEGRDVAGEAAAAVEDVVGQFIGLEAHHDAARDAAEAGPGDALTTLKGLGPRAASLLQELGVTSFAQIAAWNERDVAAIDARMGAFKGRIARDRWVDQAKLLAAGDTAAFEAEFGKLGA